MGFQDIKTDGLSIDEIREKTNEYNRQYFGEGLFSISSNAPSQVERYKQAKKKYIESVNNEFYQYFEKFGWDRSENTMRANDEVSLTLDLEQNRLSFKKPGETRETVYSIKIGSSFKENIYYRFENLKYVHNYGTPTKAEDLKKELEELKAIVEYNDGLNGEYAFYLLVNKDYYNDPIGQGEYAKYDGIAQLLNEISEKEF